jgi:hypothetical protein
MTDISEAERLRHLTHVQTDLVLNEVRLAEEAIGRVVEDQGYEDQDDPNVHHVSRGRPTALIIPFPQKRSASIRGTKS